MRRPHTASYSRVLSLALDSCFTMAWVSPLDPPGTYKASFVGYCEWTYLYIFTFELATKIIAYGFVFTPQSYLKVTNQLTLTLPLTLALV